MDEDKYVPLDEWVDSKRVVDEMSEDIDGASMTDEKGPGIVYNGGFIMGPKDGKYNLLICRTEWSSTSLERLEGILYSEWVMPEIFGVQVI